jgi:hypothetical protein
MGLISAQFLIVAEDQPDGSTLHTVSAMEVLTRPHGLSYQTTVIHKLSRAFIVR